MGEEVGRIWEELKKGVVRIYCIKKYFSKRKIKQQNTMTLAEMK